MSFQKSLETGRIAEGWIAKWLIARGASILPAYEIEIPQYKGPQVFSGEGEFVSPDLLVFSDKGILWVEAKHKSVFTWHRKTAQWTTGIDLHHYGQYMHVAKLTKLPVWLMFYHRESSPDSRDLQHGCPKSCPTGLFGGELFDLAMKENHRSLAIDKNRAGFVGHGKSGMVYWADSAFRQFATKEQVEVLGQIKAA